MRSLIIGCGYVGEALGQRLIALGHSVTGIRRADEQNIRLAKLGIHPLNLDITEAGALDRLESRLTMSSLRCPPRAGGGRRINVSSESA